MCFELLKRLASATNCAFSIQHACGLSTTPTLLVYLYTYADMTAHAQAQYWKGSSSHKTAAECCNTYLTSVGGGTMLHWLQSARVMCSTEL